MLMIKTWPGGTGAVGYVRNSVFEDFWAYDTTYALDIDQYWYEHTTPNTGAIKISDLVFRNWTGTVDNGVARGPIVIRGSDVVPLVNITLVDFAMWTVTKGAVVLQCRNVYGAGYCARELADGVAPTSFSSTVTISTTMEGYVVPTSPVWGVAGYGTTVSIPVYTPAVLWGIEAAAVGGASSVRVMATGTVSATSAVLAKSSVSTTGAAASTKVPTTLVSSRIVTSTVTSAATRGTSVSVVVTTIRTRGGAPGRSMGGRGFRM